MSDSQKIILQQALHGYDDGHDLLTSSMHIDSEVRRNLRVMSDMSGSNMVKGFEEYITGYPIKEANFYALAKTWYAPEMRRPGCVWTHTFLIKFSDLIQLNDYTELIRLFRRPSGEQDFTHYSKPLEFIPSRQIRGLDAQSEKISPWFIQKIIMLLYQNPNEAILMREDNSTRLESLLLSIWTQQWPRLKRNFSFCTGAISVRTINNSPLDLQVTPTKYDGELHRRNKNLHFVDSTEAIEVSDWVLLAFEDLTLGKSSLREFFKTFGADMREERGAYISLIRIYQWLNQIGERVKVSDAMRILVELFPSPQEGSMIKMGLLGYKKPIGPISFPVFPEEELIRELGSTNSYKLLDYTRLEFFERFESLCKSNYEGAIQLSAAWISTQVNPYGELALQNAALMVSEENVSYIIKHYKKVLLIFSSLNPKIAYLRSFWYMDREELEENFGRILKVKMDLLDWKKVTHTMLSSGASIDYGLLEESTGEALNYILEWWNDPLCPKLSYHWLNYIKHAPLDFLRWINNTEIVYNHVVRYIPDVLNPNAKYPLELGLEWREKLTSKSIFEAEYNERIRHKAFVLAIAFNASDFLALGLFEYSFEEIYYALMRDQLDYRAWKPIEAHTKSLSIWKDWDKCRKLKNAVVDHFIQNKWAPKALSKLTNDRSLLSDLEDRYKRRLN